MTELKDIVVTIKQRGKSGRWLKAKSYKGNDFLKNIGYIRMNMSMPKLTWFDKTFKTENWNDHMRVKGYVLGKQEILDGILKILNK
jgi:hypothetical protein